MWSLKFSILGLCVFVSYVEPQSCSAPFRLRGRGGFGIAGFSSSIKLEEFNKTSKQQLWKSCKQSDGSVEIINNSTGSCLDSQSCKGDQGVIAYKCHGGDNQKWYLQDYGYIQPKCNSKRFLGINGGFELTLLVKSDALTFERISA